jgi:DNA polymerase/3'-5' exonuclease PolX
MLGTICRTWQRQSLLGVKDLEDLAAACREGRVSAIKGLGSAQERKILQGITSPAKAKAGFA